MSKLYNQSGMFHQFGKARGKQSNDGLYGSAEQPLERNFHLTTLHYLKEKVIDYLLDSLSAEKRLSESANGHFNDYSFITAPAYKALEGFLFQIAKDLNLPSSGKPNLAGSYYFDEEKIDKHISALLRELDTKAESEKKLSTYEKRDIKDRIKEMRGFLQHYRNTPAHFWAAPIETLEMAHRNIMIIYGAIDNTTQILLKAKLIEINDNPTPELVIE